MSPFPYFKTTSSPGFGKPKWGKIATPLVLLLTSWYFHLVLSNLSYWKPQYWNWMMPSLAVFLRVIPFGVPTSIRRPTSPNRFDSFFTALPSILKPKRYPACVLDLDYPKTTKTQISYTSDSLYPTFMVYFSGPYTAHWTLCFTTFKEKGVNLLFQILFEQFVR